MFQDNGRWFDLAEQSDWRLNVTERNTQSSVGSAWEFFFIDT